MSMTPVAGVTHEIVLSDGVTTIGLRPSDGQGNADPEMRSWQRAPQARISPQVGAGAGKYSDIEPPFYVTAQDDFVGGRGQENLASDPTRFYDSMNLWTLTEKQAILGPRPTCDWGNFEVGVMPAKGADFITGHKFGGSEANEGRAANVVLSTKGYTVTTITLYLVRSGAPGQTLTVGLHDASGAGHTGGVVDPALATATLTDANIPNDGTVQPITVTLSAPVTLTNNYWYWVSVVASGTPTGTGYYEWPCVLRIGADPYKKTSGTWAGETGAGLHTHAFMLNSGPTDLGAPVVKLVNFNGLMWAITQPATGAGKLYYNGDMGAADSNTGALTKLNDATKSWTTNEWVDCVAWVIKGTGVRESRQITANDATSLTVSPAWDTTQDTTTTYVILGSRKWTDSGVSFTNPLTDVIVSQDSGHLIVSQGKAAIKQVKPWNDAGAWKIDSHAGDTTDHDVNCLCIWNGYLYTAFRDTDNKYKINRSSTKDYGSEFEWKDESEVPAPFVTALAPYDNVLYAFATYKVMAWDENKKKLINSDLRYGSLTDWNNGTGATVWNGFLYFPIGYGLTRLSGKQVDNIGPDQGAGMPDGRQGRIVDLCPTVGVLFAAYDADASGTSCVLAYNNFGWHEIARAAGVGRRIRAVGHQSGIVNLPSYLYYAEGNGIFALGLPTIGNNPWLYSGMNYNWSGYLITSWMDAGYALVDKFFHEVELAADMDAAGAGTYLTAITVYYQTDNARDSSTWNYVGQITSASATYAMSLTSGDTLTGKRIRFKIVLSTGTYNQSPRLRVWTLESFCRPKPKFSWTCRVVIQSEAVGINGNRDLTDSTIIAQLDTWAASATPLTLTCVDPLANGQKVAIDAFEYRISARKATPGQNEAQIEPGQRIYDGALRLVAVS